MQTHHRLVTWIVGWVCAVLLGWGLLPGLPALAQSSGTRTQALDLSTIAGQTPTLQVNGAGTTATVTLAQGAYQQDGALASGQPLGAVGRGMFHGVAYQGQVYALASNGDTGQVWLLTYTPPASASGAPALVATTPLTDINPSLCWYPASLALIQGTLYVACHHWPEEVIYAITLPGGGVSVFLDADVIPDSENGIAYDQGDVPVIAATADNRLLLTKRVLGTPAKWRIVRFNPGVWDGQSPPTQQNGVIEAVTDYARSSGSTRAMYMKVLNGLIVLADGNYAPEFLDPSTGQTAAWWSTVFAFDVVADAAGSYWVANDRLERYDQSGTQQQIIPRGDNNSGNWSAQVLVFDGRYLYGVNESSTGLPVVVDTVTQQALPAMPGAVFSVDDRMNGLAQYPSWDHQGLVAVRAGQALYLGRPAPSTLTARAYTVAAGYVPSGGPAQPTAITGIPARLETLSQVQATTTEPPGTQVQWRVSGDNGTTWQRWDAASATWVTDASTVMTTADLNAIPASAWAALPQSAITVGFSLSTTNPSLTPTVSQVALTLALPPPPTIGALICPGNLYPSSSGNCGAQVTAPQGTLTYTWTASSGTLTGSGASVTLRAGSSKPGSGVITVSLTAGYRENELVTATASVDVPILDYPLPTISSLACPATLWITQAGACQASASASAGTLQWTWTASLGTIQETGSTMPVTATVSAPSPGSATVSFRAYIAEQPERFVTASATVTIQDVPVTGTLTCPESLMKRQPGSCAAAYQTPYGSLTYSWSVTGGATLTPSADGTSATLVSMTTGTMTVTLTVQNTEISVASATVTATVPVYGWTPPLLGVTGPSRLYRKTTGTFQATTGLPQNLPPDAPTEIEVVWQANGQSQTGLTSQWTFEDAGQQTIQATARFVAANGDPDAAQTVSWPVFVSAQAPPRLLVNGPRVAIVGQPVTITAMVSAQVTGTPPPIQIQWTLPDGTTSTETTVTVTCLQAGPCQASVMAWHDGYTLPQETATATVTIRARAYAFPTNLSLVAVTERNPAAPLQALLKVDGDFTQSALGCCAYRWDYGDGTDPEELTRPRRAHVYARPGQYTPSVVVSDQFGAMQVLVGPTITVTEPLPLTVSVRPTFSNAWVRPPVSVTLTPTVTGGGKGDRIRGFTWSLNGQALSTSPRFRQVFTQPGTYPVSVTVQTTSQAVTTEVPITINPNQPPVCTVTMEELPPPALPVTVRLKANCQDPDGKVKSYRWDLGEATPVEGRVTVVRRYVEPGTYPVTLTATDNSGDSTTVTEQVVIASP